MDRKIKLKVTNIYHFIRQCEHYWVFSNKVNFTEKYSAERVARVRRGQISGAIPKTSDKLVQGYKIHIRFAWKFFHNLTNDNQNFVIQADKQNICINDLILNNILAGLTKKRINNVGIISCLEHLKYSVVWLRIAESIPEINPNFGFSLVRARIPAILREPCLSW